jgi:2-polyprenyl-6-methoxyphenol hydroxylase-like FAD-dependent oxidoreductase
MKTEAIDLIEEQGAVVGVRANSPEGVRDIRAPLVVGCDGRHSLTRQKAGLEVENLGAPMDVLWFTMRREPGDPDETMGLFEAGRIFVAINRGDYWQCGYVIPKGSFEAVQRAGLPQFREHLVQTMPVFADRVDEIANWDQVKLLTVAVDRLKHWYRRGLLCIGDAAHAMSPVGGVGINLAVQDAVAAANILAEPLLSGIVDDKVLQRVQKRREFPTRLIQRGQVFVQQRVISGVLANTGTLEPPLPVRLLQKFPILRRIPGRIIGLGIRPEHIRTLERPRAARPAAAA